MQSSNDDVPADAQPIQVSRLQTLHQTLSPAALRAQNLLSPVGRLPPEIILMIFEHFVSTRNNKELTERGALFRLCKVCSRWRHICVDTPMLWKSPVFKFTLRKRYGEVVSSILSRSAPLPISLRVDTRPLHMCRPDFLVMLDFELLRNVCNRLEDVYLCLEDAYVTQPCAPPDGGLPLLSTLNIRLGYEVPCGLLAWLADFFADSPSLRTLHLTCDEMPSNLNLQIPDFPWAKLTSLTLSVHMDDVEFYRILKACPLLEWCELKHVIDCSDGSDDPPPLTMPALHHLDFKPGKESFGYILHHLNLPKLRSLRLVSSYNVSFDPVDWLIQSHDRAPFSLQYLVMEGLDTRTTNLVRLFSRLAHSLQSLELVQSRGFLQPDGIIPFFTCDPSADEHALALPHLSRLKFKFWNNIITSKGVDGAALVHMAQSLWDAAASDARFPSLGGVNLDLGYYRLDEEVEEDLARLVRESNGYIRDSTASYRRLRYCN